MTRVQGKTYVHAENCENEEEEALTKMRPKSIVLTYLKQTLHIRRCLRWNVTNSLQRKRSGCNFSLAYCISQINHSASQLDILPLIIVEISNRDISQVSTPDHEEMLYMSLTTLKCLIAAINSFETETFLIITLQLCKFKSMPNHQQHEQKKRLSHPCPAIYAPYVRDEIIIIYASLTWTIIFSQKPKKN
uniref:Uncharacterized protein n=1 Tax=Glossina palpalis gambiensis TaxID=67801 RepID=A0A1B0BYN8_9MUSC